MSLSYFLFFWYIYSTWYLCCWWNMWKLQLQTWNVILLKYSIKWFMFPLMSLYLWVLDRQLISLFCMETKEGNISIVCCVMVDPYGEPLYQNWDTIGTIWDFILEKWSSVLFIKKKELLDRPSSVFFLLQYSLLATLQKEMLTCDRVEI